MAPKRIHPRARTTEKVRREMQRSDETIQSLARRHGVNRKTVAKWRQRTTASDSPMGPQVFRSTVLDPEQEAVIVAFRKHTRLPLDDCLRCLKKQIPGLKRSALHRCLRRHGLSKIGRAALRPSIADVSPQAFYCFEIISDDISINTGSGIGSAYSIFMAIEVATGYFVSELVDIANRYNVAKFLARVIAESPQEIFAVATDPSWIFTNASGGFDENIAIGSNHPFSLVCRFHDIEQKLALPNWFCFV